MLDTAVHELTHGLAFTYELYSKYINPATNATLGLSNVYYVSVSAATLPP